MRLTVGLALTLAIMTCGARRAICNPSSTAVN